MIGLLMNNELKGIWKDVVIALFKVLYQHLNEETEKGHKKFQSG